MHSVLHLHSSYSMVALPQLAFTCPSFQIFFFSLPYKLTLNIYFPISIVLLVFVQLKVLIYNPACHLFDRKSMLPFCVVLIHSNNMCSTLLFTRNKRHLPFSTAFPHSHTLTFHDAAPFIPPVLHTYPLSLAGTVNA